MAAFAKLFSFEAHSVRRAVSRAALTAGINNPIKIPMIPMTTSNSTSVKPDR
jgi:phosphoenolpyruvate carboxylase